MRSRRQFLVQSSAGVLAAARALPAKLKTDRPNILVILVDDLGYGDLSSYGAPDLRTSNIDNLVQSGLRFHNFYANCPVCSPTRASLLTGRNPDLVGVPGVIRTHHHNSWGYLHPEAVLLPEILKLAGYETAIVGKWHLGLEPPNTPTQRGFDHFYGFLGDMMDDYYHHRRHGINYMREGDVEIDPSGHATDLFTEAAIRYLRKPKDRPFFLYLAYNAPHTPIQPPADWLERVKARDEGWDEKRLSLVAFIEHLDRGIGRVMEALRESKLPQNTLVVFSSDNGGQSNVGASNGALAGGKQDMYEGGIRVPTCLVWPGQVAAGSETHLVVQTMDLFPTLCEIAGLSPRHQIEGRSFLSVLKGEELDSDDRILFWVRREGGRYQGRAYYAVRQGHWKLLQNSPFEPMKLFNLQQDQGERNPLDSQHPKFGELVQALSGHIIRSGSVPWQDNSDRVRQVRRV